MWWPDLGAKKECIDGSTGLLAAEGDGSDSWVSEISTRSMVRLYCQTHLALYEDSRRQPHNDEIPSSLADLREFKTRFSPKHEEVKNKLLTEHRILGQWSRRSA